MSLSQALSTATAGLRVTQSGLALTAANVANAETPGYVRKTLNTVSTTGSGASLGVRVSEIARELDQYVQRQLRTELSGGTYANLRADYYARLQQILGEPGSDSALETVFSDFTASLQALSTSPESSSARTAALNAARVLTQQLNAMSAEIQSLRSDSELGLSEAVGQANYAMEQIADINRKIATASPADAATAALLDQRDYYIDQLAELMDIRVVETDHSQLNIFTNSGVQLVGREAARLSFNTQGTVTAQSQWNADPAQSTLGTLSIVSSNGAAYDLIANKAVRSGTIAALLEMRDQVLPEAQAQLDQFAAAMTSALSDRTENGTAVTSGAQEGFEIDTAGLLAGNPIHLTYTDTTTGQQHRVTLIRVDDPSALPLPNSATADSSDEVIGLDFSGGLASVASQINSHFNGKVQVSNPSGTILRFLDDGAANNSAIDALSVTKTQTALLSGGNELPFFTDAAGYYTGAITSAGAQATGLAGRITVNAALLADPSKLVVYQAGTATGDPARPNFILDRITAATFTFSPSSGVGSTTAPFSGSLSSYLRQVISVQGEAALNATHLADGQGVVVSALKARVDEQSGVNIDREMANLLQLQSAYGANARVMSTVREMIEMLMQIL
ncbi:MAG: flagellar hook-associated protein FlgK [Pseudorhodoplanes sp.]|nr:flagellar hook-associated protein FlgK [Pseudorhodoplanes sp.]